MQQASLQTSEACCQLEQWREALVNLPRQLACIPLRARRILHGKCASDTSYGCLWVLSRGRGLGPYPKSFSPNPLPLVLSGKYISYCFFEKAEAFFPVPSPFISTVVFVLSYFRPEGGYCSLYVIPRGYCVGLSIVDARRGIDTSSVLQ